MAPLIEEGWLEAEGAEGLERLGLSQVGGRLVLLPRRVALALVPSPRSHLARLVEAFLALAQEPVDCSKLAHHRAPEVGFLLLGELLFGIVHQVLDGDEVLAEVVADDADLLDGQGGREDGTGRLVLALLDALGQRDLALAREEGDAPHLAQVEPDGVFRAPHGARRQVDAAGLDGLVVVGLGIGGLARGLAGEPVRLGRVHHLDVHGAEEHHDVVELIEGDDVRRQGVVDLVVGQVALLLALGDQLVQLLQFWLVRHACRLS